MSTVKLRKWQQEASELYRSLNYRDFLVSATPGAGKTSFALYIIDRLLKVKAIEQVIIVAPTDHLRKQWAENALNSGLFLDPSLSNSVRYVSDDYVGYVVTYAQVASNPNVHRLRVKDKKTLVVFDEIHHAGDGLTWGQALRVAFSGVSRRLSLTGTPFRTSISSTIPFVNYEKQDDGSKISKPDYNYSYGQALSDGVVRPVTFVAYGGVAKWEVDGDKFELDMSEAGSSDLGDVLKTVFDKRSPWIKEVFKQANDRLMEIRGSIPDAGGLILASDQESARAYAKVLYNITGESPVVVTSDDNKASEKISDFAAGVSPWIIAVRMVSEGVDIPRLAVGVWATNYRTPLFFAQAVGRFVRARRKGEIAVVFLPAVKPLLALAASMEEERNHVVFNLSNDNEEGEDESDDEEDEEVKLRRIKEFLASSAEFDHVLFNGRAIDGSEEIYEEFGDILGLPGLLTPQQMAILLRKQSLEDKKGSSDSEQRENVHKKIMETRKSINKLISRTSIRKGVSHARLHKQTQTAVPGPPSSVATLKILEDRLEWLENKFL